MKLLLCSYGPWKNSTLEKAFLELLTKPVKENKVVILSMNTTSDFYKEYLKTIKTWYKQIGFQESNIKTYNLETDNIPSFEDLDVLFMCGGNTYHYLQRTRERDLSHKIRDFINRARIYVGSSAGSNIMCLDVNPNLTGDVNDINLVDLEGFGYFRYNIIVHWDTMNSHLRTKQMNYIWESGEQVITLTDQQAIQIKNNEWKIISPDII